MPRYEVAITFGCGTIHHERITADSEFEAEELVMGKLREKDYREWSRVYDVEVIEIT